MPSKTYIRRLKKQRRLHKRRLKHRLKRIKKNINSQKNKNRHELGSKRLARKLKQGKFEVISAPQTFSFQYDPEEAGNFFMKLENAADKQHPIRIDLSKVKTITVDTLLYLLAILERYKSRKINHHVEGNLPRHQEAYRSFQDSGFLSYVSNPFSSSNNPAIKQIVAGDKVDQETARQFCNLVLNSFGWTRKQTHFLFEILIEMMANTVQHAYKNKAQNPSNNSNNTSESNQMKKTPTKWYLYAEYNPNDKVITFCFLDTGEGIPNTLKRTYKEKLSSFAQPFMPADIEPKDSQLISSALKGDFRTQTGLKYRGKGLPRISGFYEKDLIQDLLVLSNHGLVKSGNPTDIQTLLKGTLYTWKVAKGDQ